MEEDTFWSDSVNDIACEFRIPLSTAASWERNIGGLDVLKEELGIHGPDHYLDLLRRREWIPREREERVDEWLEPLRRWCASETDGVYLVHDSDREDFREEHGVGGWQSFGLGSEWRAVASTDGAERVEDDDSLISSIDWTVQMALLRENLEQKEERVKYEMRRVDPDWIELTKELWEVEKELIDIYRSFLASVERTFEYKKDKIIELKHSFPYLRANPMLVAQTTNSSYSYVTEFKHIPGEGVANRRVKGKLRDTVLERDDHSCVSCGSENDLQVHHIIPRDLGGANEKDNLATLCSECHYYAHGGGKRTTDGNYSAADWNNVEYAGHTDFWNEWIDRDFDGRGPKDYARVDSDS